MKTMLFVASGLVLCAALLTGLWSCQRASAHDDGTGSFAQHKADWIKKELTAKLALTEEQTAELDRIVATLLAKHAEIHAMRQDFRDDFFDMLRQEQVTPEEVRELFASRRPAFEEMITALSEGLADFHAVLTPEQREKLIAEVEAHRQHCRWGHRW